MARKFKVGQKVRVRSKEVYDHWDYYGGCLIYGVSRGRVSWDTVVTITALNDWRWAYDDSYSVRIEEGNSWSEEAFYPIPTTKDKLTKLLKEA